MRNSARRVPVGTDPPVIGGNRYDYSDAFEIRLPRPDPRTAEDLMRLALEGAPALVRWTVWVAHRHVLRLRLGAPSAPGRLAGWSIRASEPDVVQVTAESRWLGAAIVLRRPDPAGAVVTTYVRFKRQAPARAVWLLVGPLHRRIAPYLLERAAAAVARSTPSPAARQ